MIFGIKFNVFLFYCYSQICFNKNDFFLENFNSFIRNGKHLSPRLRGLSHHQHNFVFYSAFNLLTLFEFERRMKGHHQIEKKVYSHSRQFKTCFCCLLSVVAKNDINCLEFCRNQIGFQACNSSDLKANDETNARFFVSFCRFSPLAESTKSLITTKW